MKILIDNGHGINTPGKCSPDGVFREYKYTRKIAAAVVKHLGYRGLRRGPGHSGGIRCFTPGAYRARQYLVPAAGQEECLPGFHPYQRCRRRKTVDERPRLDLLHLPRPDGRRPAFRLLIPRRSALAPRAQAPEGLLRRRSRLGKRLLHPEEYPLCRGSDGESFPRQLRRLPLPGIRRRPPGDCSVAR